VARLEDRPGARAALQPLSRAGRHRGRVRVLFCTWDIAGHLTPLVPFGWALRAAGHEVLVASAPGFAPRVARAGLPALPVGPDFDSFAVLTERVKARGWRPTLPVDRRNPAPDTVERIRRRGLTGLRVAAQAADAQADDLVRFCRRWRPDLVVYEPSGYAGPLVGRLLGVPAVRVLWGVDISAPVADFEHDVVGDLARRFGLPALGINGTVTLDPCPARLQLPAALPRQPVRYVPYNGPSVVPGWLREPPAARRVCVSWGTSLPQWGFGRLVLAPLVVEALADVDVEVVVAVTEDQRELFGPLPPNVRHLGPVPLSPLLPSCAAIVHHGGSGSTMTALATAVPQLAVAHVPDSVFHARQIEHSGTGRALLGDEATGEAIRRDVLALLDEPGYRRVAGELRDEMAAMPSPADLVGFLEKLAEQPGTGDAG
jgi:UDP:flavonoid glycosyltransferase YjiC (YdhE family)